MLSCTLIFFFFIICLRNYNIIFNNYSAYRCFTLIICFLGFVYCFIHKKYFVHISS